MTSAFRVVAILLLLGFSSACMSQDEGPNADWLHGMYELPMDPDALISYLENGIPENYDPLRDLRREFGDPGYKLRWRKYATFVSKLAETDPLRAVPVITKLLKSPLPERMELDLTYASLEAIGRQDTKPETLEAWRIVRADMTYRFKGRCVLELGKIGDVSALPAVLGLLNEVKARALDDVEEWDRTAGRVRALKDVCKAANALGSPAGIEALIEVLRDTRDLGVDPSTSFMIVSLADVLHIMTGEPIGPFRVTPIRERDSEIRKWAEWWALNRSNFTVRTDLQYTGVHALEQVIELVKLRDYIQMGAAPAKPGYQTIDSFLKEWDADDPRAIATRWLQEHGEANVEEIRALVIDEGESPIVRGKAAQWYHYLIGEQGADYLLARLFRPESQDAEVVMGRETAYGLLKTHHKEILDEHALELMYSPHRSASAAAIHSISQRPGGPALLIEAFPKLSSENQRSLANRARRELTEETQQYLFLHAQSDDWNDSIETIATIRNLGLEGELDDKQRAAIKEKLRDPFILFSVSAHTEDLERMMSGVREGLSLAGGDDLQYVGVHSHAYIVLYLRYSVMSHAFEVAEHNGDRAEIRRLKALQALLFDFMKSVVDDVDEAVLRLHESQ